VRQIVDWLGADFDGVIIFDESHAMQNAAGNKSERGDQPLAAGPRRPAPATRAAQRANRVRFGDRRHDGPQSRLCPAARPVGGEDFPFATRAEFVEAIEAGGRAAMECWHATCARSALYAARSLSYEGVEYDLVEHQLTTNRYVFMIPMPAPSESFTTISMPR